MKPETRDPKEPSVTNWDGCSLRPSRSEDIVSALRSSRLCVKSGHPTFLRSPFLTSQQLRPLPGFDGAPIQTQRPKDRRGRNSSAASQSLSLRSSRLCVENGRPTSLGLRFVGFRQLRLFPGFDAAPVQTQRRKERRGSGLSVSTSPSCSSTSLSLPRDYKPTLPS
jgi:hypothetical protein